MTRRTFQDGPAYRPCPICEASVGVKNDWTRRRHPEGWGAHTRTNPDLPICAGSGRRINNGHAIAPLEARDTGSEAPR